MHYLFKSYLGNLIETTDMNLAHRYSTWLPLNSQQMRLRNLQCIQGINFDYQPTQLPNYTAAVYIYYSLHLDPKSESFYQSEKLRYRRCLYLKWADIQCETLTNSNLNCICVKVWAWLPNKNTSVKTELVQNNNQIPQTIRDCFPAVNKPSANSCNELIFSCGVYLSGLTPVYPFEANIHRSNSLIFQINDNYFTFHENLIMDSYHQPTHFSNDECRDNLLDTTTKPAHAETSSSPSVINTNANAPYTIGKRYIKINYIQSKTKLSYNLEKLLKLQKLQRKRLQFQKETIDLSTEIKQHSLRCITNEQLSKSSTTHGKIYPPYISVNTTASSNKQKSSMGRTLSLLLSERHWINPHQLLQAQQLQQQIEMFTNKQRVLQHICDTLKKQIMESRKYLQLLAISRRKLDSWLEMSNNALQTDKFNWMKSHSVRLEMRIKKRAIVNNLERRMAGLCLELREIYPVECNHKVYNTVCGIPFFSMENNSIDDFSSQNSLQITENISTNALSASFSYVAHLIQMIAVIINCPLRNPIVYEGPRSHILKSHKPPFLSAKELPLYNKIAVPIEPVRCTLTLLIQNVCQLRYHITNSCNDEQNITHNLLHIFMALANKCKENGNENARHQDCTTLSKPSQLNDRIYLTKTKIEESTQIIHDTCDQAKQILRDTHKLSNNVNLLINSNNISNNEGTLTNSKTEQNKNAV